MQPLIRPATQADVEAYYGGPVPFSMKAVVVIHAGEPIGLAGYYYDRNQIIAFSGMKPPMRRFKRAIFKVGEEVKKLLGSLPAIAIADPNEPSAARWLEHVGFRRLGRVRGMEVYQWT